MEMMYNSIHNDAESIYALIYIGNEILSLEVIREAFQGVLETQRNGKHNPMEWCLEYLPSIATVIVAQTCPSKFGINPKNVLLVKAFIHWLAIVFHFIEKTPTNDDTAKVLIKIVDEALKSSYAYINYGKTKPVAGDDKKDDADSSSDEIDGVKIPSEAKIERIVNILIRLSSLHKLDVDSLVDLLDALGAVTTGKFKMVLDFVHEHKKVIEAFGHNPEAFVKAAE